MRFIRIITQGQHQAFFNMALDEAISEAARKKLSPPTLRLYQWDRPSLSIGFFQKTNDINISYCNKKKYPIVRRLTGGRAILHDRELTYSFSASKDFTQCNGNLHEDYKIISNALVSGLRGCGINAKSSFSKRKNAVLKSPACFKSVSYGEIAIDGKKIVGSAQKRYRNGFLQHGSIMMDFNADELDNTLNNINKEDYRDIGSVIDYTPEISMIDLEYSLKTSFEKELGVKLIADNPSEFEQSLAKRLEENKYSTEEWNFRK